MQRLPSAMLISAAIVLGSCSLAARHRGQERAQQWASDHGEVIERALYVPPNHLDPPEILVHLRSDVSAEATRLLFCEELEPDVRRAGDELLGVTLWGSGDVPVPQPDCS